MPEDPDYLIGELAQKAGVTVRTIRYYTSEGLLPQPETRGRYARYTRKHLQLIQQIAALKAQYLPLYVIREQLAAADLPALQDSVPEGMRDPRQATQVAHVGVDHINGIQAQGNYDSAVLATDSPASAGSAPQLGRYQFFPDLPEPIDASVSKGIWQRILLAPGIELHVQEPISAERRMQIDDLIAMARTQLV